MPTCWAMVPKTSPLLRGLAETPTLTGLVRSSFEAVRMDPGFPFFTIPHPPPPLWASPGFVDTPNRTKSAIGVGHGEEAAAAIVLAGVQGGSGQGGAAEREESRRGGA